MKPEAKGRPSFPVPSSVLALAAAAAVAAVLVAASSPNPAAALRAFFAAPWSSAWFLGNTLDAAALLCVAAVGAAVAFRAGTFNLGGEGQVYAGGVAAAAVILGTPLLPAPLALVLAAAAALAVGGAAGWISGALKARWGADELITSFLLASATAPIADFLVSGPLRDPSASLLATARFPADRVLPRLLEPSRLNLSAPLALAVAAAAAFFLSRTAAGFRLRVAGAGASFARFAGVDPARAWPPAMAASGALHGLAGFFAVAGTYGICHRGFGGGLGWNALAVALVARNAPAAVVPAALAYAALQAGSDAVLLTAGAGFETAAFVQAAVFLLVTVRWSRLAAGRRARAEAGL